MSRSLFVLSVLSFYFNLFGAVIYTDVSRDSLTLGERVEFTVSIVAPSGAVVEPPETENGFGKFSVKEWLMDRFERESSDSITFRYSLTLYTVEPCSIPALPYILISGEEKDTLSSSVRPMRVLSVIDTDSAKIQDLKPQQRAGKPSMLWLWLIITLAAVSAAVFTIRHLWIKHKKPPPPLPPKPPYEEAVDALNALEAKQYLVRGMIREYTFELSEIFKRYIGRRFEVNAAEYTTEEMLRWIKVSPINDTLRRSLAWFFNETDPVKFAKMIPGNDTVTRFGAEVRSFLEETRPGSAEETGTPVEKERKDET